MRDKDTKLLQEAFFGIQNRPKSTMHMDEYEQKIMQQADEHLIKGLQMYIDIVGEPAGVKWFANRLIDNLFAKK